jgi:hypothetical protein
MNGRVKSIEDSIDWMQSVAAWTAKATERVPICRRIFRIFRGPAFFEIVEGAVQCIQSGVTNRREEKLRVSELVYVLNSIQTIRERLPKEYDWQTRLQTIVQDLLLKYEEIFRQDNEILL